MAGIERHTFGGTSLEVTTPGFGAMELRGTADKVGSPRCPCQPSLRSEWLGPSGRMPSQGACLTNLTRVLDVRWLPVLIVGWRPTRPRARYEPRGH